MKRTPIALIAPLLLASASVAPAASILIDFGRSGTGFTTPSTPEATWNNVNTLVVSDPEDDDSTPLTGGSLLDSNGVDSGVTLHLLAVNGLAQISGVANYPTLVEGLPLSASRDYLTLRDGNNDTTDPATATFQLGGLLANGVYDLTFFAGLPFSTDRPIRPLTGWIVNGATSETVSVYAPDNTSTVTARVQADADGNIEIVWNNGTDFTGVMADADTAVWNTLEIAAIPEPSSTALVGAALAFGCFTRRRR